jgi:hypothetical protein
MASSRLAMLATLFAGCATVRSAPTTTLTVREAAGEVSLPALLQRADATVFVFWSAGCPCVRRYQARVEALKAQYAGRVAFVAVSSNADETLESVTASAVERGVTLPFVRDEGGGLARSLNARTTPTVVLVQRDGTVRFTGWLDNEHLPGEGDREPWLERALEGFTAHTAFAARSPTWGCTITRSLGAARECHADTTAPASQGLTP